MSVKGGLALHLKANAGVSAIVGSRVYIAPMPQAQPLPFVVFHRQGTDHVRSLEGPSGLRRTEFDVRCYSTDSAQVEALGEAVRLALDGWSGVWSSIRVTNVFVEYMEDAEIADQEGGEEVVFQVELGIIVWHVESVPS